MDLKEVLEVTRGVASLVDLTMTVIESYRTGDFKRVKEILREGENFTTAAKALADEAAKEKFGA